MGVHHVLLLSCTLATLVPGARAQTTGAGELTYPVDFYASFQPQTALDMLERTPGFILAEGDLVRGFGAAAGNVLIDGQRPTVKAGGIEDVLRRIPASQVERILLIRGGEAAQAQGQTLVANVVRRPSAKAAGTLTAGVARKMGGRYAPSASASLSGPIGGWQTSVELSAEWDRYPVMSDHVVRDGDGTLVETRRERELGKAPEWSLSTSAAHALAGGELTINGRLAREGYRATRTFDIQRPAEAIGRTILYDERYGSAELGVDWTRPLGRDWSTKIATIGRIERYDSDEDYTEPGYRGLSALRQKPAELVARVSLSREGDHGLRPEIGGEVAWNRLSSRLAYAEDVGGALTPVALTGAHTRVSELRGEAFANLNANLSRTIGLEAGLAFELSRISVSGDVSRSQNLSYLKPSLALLWSPRGATQLRLSVRRTVDQLSFESFAASVNQADGRPLGGNAQLRPARITRALARIDHRWGKGAAISAEFFHQWSAGFLGYVLLPSGDQAQGVIGDGRQWGLTGQATLPLSALLNGAQIKLDGTLSRSRIRDPLTGVERALDGIIERQLNAEFRHDVPTLKSSWGLRYAAPMTERYHYVGEALLSRDRATWTAYAETTAFARVKTVLTLDAFSGEDGYRQRRYHDPSAPARSSGTEERFSREGVTVSLSLSKAL